MSILNSDNRFQKIAEEMANNKNVSLDSYSTEERKKIHEFKTIIGLMKNKAKNERKPSREKFHETLQSISLKEDERTNWGSFFIFKNFKKYSMVITGLVLFFGVSSYLEHEKTNLSIKNEEIIMAQELSLEINEDFLDIYDDFEKLAELEEEINSEPILLKNI